MERETVSLNRIEERHSLEVQPHLGSVGAVHPPAPRTHVSTLTKHPAYLLDIAYLQIETEKTIENEIHIAKKDLDRLRKELLDLQKEKEVACRKHAEDLAAKSSWNTLSLIAQYLAGSASLVLAIPLLFAAPWAGALLLTSGILALTNRVIQDTVGMKTIAAWFTKSAELQQTYAQRIEAGFLILSLGTGLAGGIVGLASGQWSLLASTQTMIKKVALAIQLSSTGIGIISKIGQIVIDKRLNTLDIQKVLLDDKTEITKKRMEQISSQLQEALTHKSLNDDITRGMLANPI